MNHFAQTLALDLLTANRGVIDNQPDGVRLNGSFRGKRTKLQNVSNGAQSCHWNAAKKYPQGKRLSSDSRQQSRPLYGFQRVSCFNPSA
ncbi:hypothetical protein [Sphingopyxis panaciterrae]